MAKRLTKWEKFEEEYAKLRPDYAFVCGICGNACLRRRIPGDHFHCPTCGEPVTAAHLAGKLVYEKGNRIDGKWKYMPGYTERDVFGDD